MVLQELARPDINWAGLDTWEAEVVKNLKQGSTIELAPTDTLVFDLSSQNWGVRLDEVPVTACHTHHMGHLYADQPA